MGLRRYKFQKILGDREVDMNKLDEVMSNIRDWGRSQITNKLSKKAVRYLSLWDALEKLNACSAVGGEVCWTNDKEMQLIWVTWETWMGIGAQEEWTEVLKCCNWRGVLENAIRAMELPWGGKWRRDLPYPRLRFWRKIHFEMRYGIMWIDRGFIPDDVGPLTQDPNGIDPFLVVK